MKQKKRIKVRVLCMAVCLMLFNIIGNYQKIEVKAEENKVFTAKIENTDINGNINQIDCTFKVTKEVSNQTDVGEVQVGNGSDPAIDVDTKGDIKIPNEIKDARTGFTYRVTTIGYNGFGECHGITSTGLKNNHTITTIGEEAYLQCERLTSTGLETNTSVTTIGYGAFSQCDGLTSTGLESNRTVTSLGMVAFQSCEGLTSTGLETNTTLKTIDEGTFFACGNLTSTGLETNKTVTNIEFRVFSHCKNLRSTGLEKNETVSKIGDYAFSNCFSLISTGLESNSRISDTGAYVFDHCINLKSTGLEKNETVVNIGEYAFSHCYSLVSTGLESNHTVTTIGKGAFSSCSSLTNTGLETNTTLTMIVDGMFNHCDGLETTGLEKNTLITKIGDRAFLGCEKLTSTSLELNTTVTTIGKGAFSSCSSLKSTGLETNTTITAISDYAFWNCNSLKSTSLETNTTLTTVGNGAFSSCSSLTSTGLETNTTLTTIGDRAFLYDQNLKEVILPSDSKIQSFGDNAFSDCPSLTAFVITGKTIPSFANDVFRNTANDFAIYYPTHISNGTVSIAPEDIETGKQIKNSFTKGTKVTINANKSEGQTFENWSINDGAIKPENPTDPTTTFIMNDEVVNIQANYNYINHIASIENGSGTGTYHIGDNVSITAKPADKGKHFKEWQIVKGNVTLEDSTKETTSFTMPSEDVEIKAVYEDTLYNVVVENGESDKTTSTYKTQITITAKPADKGKHFKEWQIVKGNVTLEDSTKETTNFTMPSEDVEIKAVYENDSQPIDYHVSNGANGTWVKGKDKTYQLNVDGKMDKFVNIKINGEVLDAKYYEVKGNNTFITLSQAYLEGLKEGQYTIDIQYLDGTAQTSLRIENELTNKEETSNKKNDVIDTGDTTSIGLTIGSMALACIVMLMLYRKRESMK